VGFCEECGGEVKKEYRVDTGYLLCGKCSWKEYLQEEEDRRQDMDRYCLSCGNYSEILEGGQCPMCFEMGGYIGYSRLGLR